MPILQGLAQVCVNIFCRFVQNIPAPPAQKRKNDLPSVKKHPPDQAERVFRLYSRERVTVPQSRSTV